MTLFPYCLRDVTRPYAGAASVLFAARETAWRRYELACWREAMEQRGLRFQNLPPEIQSAMIQATNDGPRRA